MLNKRRRDFLKTIVVIVATTVLAACAPVLQVSSSPTSTALPTLTETLLPLPTSTSTLRPTETMTPTGTPSPMWHMNYGPMPHTVNPKGQETFNFKAAFAEWPELPNLTSSSIREYHESLKKVHLSDGSLLVKPMVGPDFDNLPPFNWRFIERDEWYDVLAIGNENVGNPDNPPTRFVGGFIYHFYGSAKNNVTMYMVGITMQLRDPSRPEGYSLWTALYPQNLLEGMHAEKLGGFLNNSIQLNPVSDFQPSDETTPAAISHRVLTDEGWYDADLQRQAMKDVLNGIPTNYFDSNVIVAETGFTYWIPAAQ